MAKVIKFRPTKQSIYRAALREMEKMYRVSHGGSDPIIDDYSRELFENGYIDEVKWLSWNRYCQKVLADLEEETQQE